jgi:hypothetical protein
MKGLQTLMSVLEERKAKGIKDEVGKEAAPIPNGTNKYESLRISRKTFGPVILNLQRTS